MNCTRLHLFRLDYNWNPRFRLRTFPLLFVCFWSDRSIPVLAIWIYCAQHLILGAAFFSYNSPDFCPMHVNNLPSSRKIPARILYLLIIFRTTKKHAYMPIKHKFLVLPISLSLRAKWSNFCFLICAPLPNSKSKTSIFQEHKIVISNT